MLGFCQNPINLEGSTVTHIKKLIHDPLYGRSIDVGHLLPIIDSPHFQRLSGKKQLGMTYLVFRGATHTRFQHCLGAYRATRTLLNGWIAACIIEPEWLGPVSVYGLIHDIGHPAFSHVTEDFCAMDDDERTLYLIENEYRGRIERCGVDPDMVLMLARREHPLYLAVHDKNLGMEKLDYLERDGAATGFNCPSGIRDLREYVLWMDDQLVVDVKMRKQALHVLDFYMTMYGEVYFRKALVIDQRMVHKGVYHLIESGELDREALYDLTDAELWGGYFFRSRHPVVAEMYRRLEARACFCEAVAIRPEDAKQETRVRGKHITPLGVDAATMQKLVDSPRLQKKSHADLEALERSIEQEVGLPPGTVLVAPVFNPERFRTQDVKLYGDNGIESLEARNPKVFAGMRETARMYTALRVCTTPEHRERLSRAAAGVLDVVLAHVA